MAHVDQLSVSTELEREAASATQQSRHRPGLWRGRFALVALLVFSLSGYGLLFMAGRVILTH